MRSIRQSHLDKSFYLYLYRDPSVNRQDLTQGGLERPPGIVRILGDDFRATLFFASASRAGRIWLRAPGLSGLE